MSTNFDNPSRFSPAGVTTAAVLVVVLSMGISTLTTPEASQHGNAVMSPTTNVAQMYRQGAKVLIARSQ